MKNHRINWPALDTVHVMGAERIMITDGSGYDAIFIDPIELLKVLKEKEPKIYWKIAAWVIAHHRHNVED